MSRFYRINTYALKILYQHNPNLLTSLSIFDDGLNNKNVTSQHTIRTITMYETIYSDIIRTTFSITIYTSKI